MALDSVTPLFHFDALTGIMLTLVGFLGLVVAFFSRRYMQGDSRYYRFFAGLACLICSVSLLAAADHLLLFISAWGLSNLLLVRLMIHNPTWNASKHSGMLATKTFIIGFISLACAFALLYHDTQQTSIQAILHSLDEIRQPGIIATLILISAISQSAIWPCHRWLISSLNSPTPVSAIMHAGLVNGGGFLLIRFAHLYDAQPAFLYLIFVLGLGTAVIGTLWKLMQNDIKRMLACSTVAQMGFMFVQCGLGLFPAAVAHLCWHGLFKANLFLSCNSVVHEKRFSMDSSPTIKEFMLACLCGFLASFLFAFASHKSWLHADTTLILLGIVSITATQIALKLLQGNPWKNLTATVLITALLCILYGYSVRFFEYALTPLDLTHPQALTSIHYAGFILLVALWIMMLFNHKSLSPMLYVKALNASQPNPSTITSHRNYYNHQRV